jgi:hypothetical protein
MISDDLDSNQKTESEVIIEELMLVTSAILPYYNHRLLTQSDALVDKLS